MFGQSYRGNGWSAVNGYLSDKLASDSDAAKKTDV